MLEVAAILEAQTACLFQVVDLLVRGEEFLPVPGRERPAASHRGDRLHCGLPIAALLSGIPHRVRGNIATRVDGIHLDAERGGEACRRFRLEHVRFRDVVLAIAQQNEDFLAVAGGFESNEPLGNGIPDVRAGIQAHLGFLGIGHAQQHGMVQG
jgi:hypothetical protein